MEIERLKVRSSKQQNSASAYRVHRGTGYVRICFISWRHFCDQLILASYPVFGFRHFSMCPTLVQALKMYEVREQVLDSDQWDRRHNYHHHHHPKRDVAGSFCYTGSNPSIQHVLWPFTGASSESTIWRQSHHRTDQGAA